MELKISRNNRAISSSKIPATSFCLRVFFEVLKTQKVIYFNGTFGSEKTSDILLLPITGIQDSCVTILSNEK